MKTLPVQFLALSLFLAACSGGHDQQQSRPRVIKSKTVLRSFTDTAKLDTFNIVLKGNKPAKMELIFTITPEKGHPVYTKTLKAKDLLDNYKETVDLDKEKKQVQFLKEELDLFFEDENFIEPAVTGTEKPDENAPDKDFFSELKKSSLNGFKYRTGKESKVYIAWSNKEKRVKIYYQCCQP